MRITLMVPTDPKRTFELPGSEKCREDFVSVERIVVLAHGDEMAEAEPFEYRPGALIVFRGEEGVAQPFFQAWMECRADNDGLYRERAPGLDHAQPLAEGRHLS